ncbi:MAG: hypothetical protein K2N24_11385 [Lachnospiraceae bacterium]|nr:hypothetical protein [Lachnospiraceae bacterium]
MTDHEFLLAMSEMMDKKLEPVKKDVQDTKLFLEDDIFPRLQNIESCYTSTYRRYAGGVEELDALKEDMEIVKKVVSEHSEKLQKIG